MSRSSYWRDRRPDRPGEADRLPTRADVAVVGAGVTGLAVAAELSLRGAAVAVLEARRVAAGTTGASTAKVTALHAARLGDLRARRGEEVASAYVQANVAGLEQLRLLARAAGASSVLHDGLAVTYSPGRDQDERIRDTLDAARAVGLPARELSASDHGDLPLAVSSGVSLEGQAMADPVALCDALAGLVRDRGGTLVEECRVRALDGTTVHTDLGQVDADAVVVATLLPAFDPTLLFARVEPMMSYTLAAELAGPAPAAMYLGLGEPTRSVRPERPGSTVAIIGGGGHRVGAGGDTRQHRAELESWARSTFDVRELRSQWQAHDLESVDLVPFIGPVGRRGSRERTYVASGFGKWGMTHAGAASVLVADSIDGCRPQWAAPFDPRRLLHDLRSAGQLVSTNVTVGRHFVGDRLASSARSVERIAPGDAAVVRIGGRKVAARRTEDGTLVTRSAVCPHLGCEVVWNRAASTWDCPCHGSRFDDDGGVLDGPAVDGLSER